MNRQNTQPLAVFIEKWQGIGFLSFMGVRISRFGRAHVAQLAEHVLGKDEVISSILIMGSILDRVCADSI